MKKRTKYRSEENEQNKNEKSLDANRFKKKKMSEKYQSWILQSNTNRQINKSSQ